MGIGIMFFRVLGMIGMLAEELSRAAEDGKITVSELIVIGRKVCDHLGIDLDEEGVSIEVPGE